MNLMVRGLTSWGRIQTLFQAQPSVADGSWTRKDLTALHGAIEFRHVSLARGGRPLLHDINLNIPEGATVGITGPTGSGKTLLAYLLVRLLDPSEGQIFVGIKDIREYPLSVLRRHIGIAAQEPFLFAESISNNILFGVDQPDQKTLEWAAEVAQLHGEVELFPERYETLVGERGVTLSGGQRRRAAISRAVARNPEILILDDVLAAVDTHTEAEILKRLRGVLRERTALLISHRISTLREADLIVVLEKGRVTQTGTHAELLAQEGYYQHLERVQRLEAALESTP
jgi:ATP-binding cassette subfamily B protein